MRQVVERAARSGGASPASYVGDTPVAWTPRTLGGVLTALEHEDRRERRDPRAGERKTPPQARAAVLGVTGTGGAGKSSLVDELVVRLLRDFPDLKVAILAVDPTKRKTGGALLGDRLRMNAVYREGVFLRSLATRHSGTELSPVVTDAVPVLAAAGADLVIVETTGIGQGSSRVLDIADLSLYVMTSDFGGPTQLEKIDMLDYADVVAVNKADRRGAADAERLVRRQLSRATKEPGGRGLRHHSQPFQRWGRQRTVSRAGHAAGARVSPPDERGRRGDRFCLH